MLIEFDERIECLAEEEESLNIVCKINYDCPSRKD